MHGNKLLEKYIVEPLGYEAITFNIKPNENPNFFIRKISKIYTNLKLIFIFNYFSFKFVITTIDNDILFQKLSRKYKHIKFYAIQNGNRSKNELLNDFKNNLTNYFCFGDHEEIEFKKYVHKADKFFKVGSFNSSIADKEIIKNNLNKIKFDIVYISQWVEKVLLNQDNYHEVVHDRKNIDNFLIKLVNKNNLNLCIVIRSGENSIEDKYFKKLIEGEGNINLFYYYQKNIFDTYKVMNHSKLVISQYSTTGVENFAKGRKSLFIDFSKDNRFSNYKNGIWIEKKYNYKKLENKIIDILKMSFNDYKKLTLNYANYLMRYDENKPTFEKIREIIYKDIN